MSLLTVFHDSKRAVVACDDRSIAFGPNGEAIAQPQRVPKFAIVGRYVVAIAGRSDFAQSLTSAIERTFVAHPKISLNELADIFSFFAQKAWTSRSSVPNQPANNDVLEIAIVGHDGERIRSFAATSQDDFKMQETTADPAARIFCLGHYKPEDLPTLQGLTLKMQQAHTKGIPWIADALRSAMNSIQARHPVFVGSPSYFVALDKNGFVELPEHFPSLPYSTPALAAGSHHHATIVKEIALLGTGRFYVGSIFTPFAGGPSTVGNSDGGSGAQEGLISTLRMTAAVTNGLGGSGLLGNGTAVNLQNAIDGDPTTFCVLTVTGNGSGNEAIVFFSGIAGIAQRFYEMSLQIYVRCLTNNLSPAGSFGTFTLAYSVTGPVGPFTTVEAIVPPTTFPLQWLSIPIPITAASGVVCVIIGATSFSTQTSGQCIVEIGDVILTALN